MRRGRGKGNSLVGYRESLPAVVDDGAYGPIDRAVAVDLGEHAGCRGLVRCQRAIEDCESFVETVHHAVMLVSGQPRGVRVRSVIDSDLGEGIRSIGMPSQLERGDGPNV